MSRIPYTINVDEYICGCLEQIRKMVETHDFSSLLAVTERIQYHATKMESALYSYEDIKYKVSSKVDKEGLTDEEFRDYVRDLVKKWTKDDE